MGTRDQGAGSTGFSWGLTPFLTEGLSSLHPCHRCLHPFSTGRSVPVDRRHPNGLILTQSPLERPHFQIQSDSEVLVVRASTYKSGWGGGGGRGGHNSAPNHSHEEMGDVERGEQLAKGIQWCQSWDAKLSRSTGLTTNHSTVKQSCAQSGCESKTSSGEFKK